MRDDTEQPQEDIDRGGRRGGVIRIDRPDDITSKLLLRKRNISPFSTNRHRQLKPGLPELSTDPVSKIRNRGEGYHFLNFRVVGGYEGATDQLRDAAFR